MLTPHTLNFTSYQFTCCPLVITKLWKMVEQSSWQHAPSSGCQRSSPMVLLRKPDGDWCIWSDYKLCCNCKIYSDLYMIPSTASAINVLIGIKFYAMIHLKTSYHQIQFDDNLKEIVIINNPIGWQSKCRTGQKRQVSYFRKQYKMF